MSKNGCLSLFSFVNFGLSEEKNINYG